MGLSQKEAIASLHSSLGLGQRKNRPSPASRRREVAQAQVACLERVLTDIRRKARETPAWATAYNSAATSVELEIQAIRKEAGL